MSSSTTTPQSAQQGDSYWYEQGCRSVLDEANWAIAQWEQRSAAQDQEIAGLRQDIRDLRQNLDQAQAQAAQPQPAQPQGPAISNPPVNNKQKGNVAKPMDFWGKDYKDFWRACQLYMADNADNFQKDQHMITFILSYCKTGNAAVWAEGFMMEKQQVFADQLSINVDAINPIQVPYEKWVDFSARFIALFKPKGRETGAISDKESRITQKG